MTICTPCQGPLHVTQHQDCTSCDLGQTLIDLELRLLGALPLETIKLITSDPSMINDIISWCQGTYFHIGCWPEPNTGPSGTTYPTVYCHYVMRLI